MRHGRVPVGPRGLALLAAVGLAGMALAVHGWSTRGAAPLAAIGVNGHPSSTRTSAGPPSRPAAGRTANPHSAGRTASGPLLSSQPFASYAYPVWPGTPSSAAKAASVGLAISVHRVAGGVSVQVAVDGQSSGPAHTYPGGSKVYVVEASLGDESGNADYNLGDDGLVVTNAAGRIVQ